MHKASTYMYAVISWPRIGNSYFLKAARFSYLLNGTLLSYSISVICKLR